MKSFTPFPGITVSYSHRTDGSFCNLDSVRNFFNYKGAFPISFLQLEHSNRIVKVSQPLEEVHMGDAIMTNLNNHTVTLVVGDCFPVVVFDSKHHACALIHCGWKSLAQNIIALTVQELHNTYQSNPEELMTWIGPGICKMCYIQKEKPDQFEDQSWKSSIQTLDDQNYSVDLVQFIDQQLQQLGIKKDHIINENLCTFMETELLFSHRRATKTNDEDGRFFVTATVD